MAAWRLMAHLTWAVVCSLLAVQQAAWAEEEEERLPGWKGEMQLEGKWDPLNHEPTKDPIPLPSSRGWVENVAWQPRVFIYHNLITDQEAKHLIELAAPSMKRSTVVGPGGKSVEDSYRTSFGTFLRRYQDEVVKKIEHRLAAWTHLPTEHQEDMQILRYSDGQTYKVHSDTLVDPRAGVRVATVLIYLNDPDEGGETAFPDSVWVDPTLEARYGANFSACARGHVAFTPKRGDALLFWSIGPDGTTEDYHASHTGCPVTKGVKWTATKWIHAKPFRPEEMARAKASGQVQVYTFKDPGICTDDHAQCEQWKKRGECEKNREDMVVGLMDPGRCRKACGACTVCAEGDKQCYRNNRESIGFLAFDPNELRPFKDAI